MSNEKKQILEMLAQGKITVQEAETLLSAVGSEISSTGAEEVKPTKQVKFLRISVDSSESDKVNIKIPINFLKAGLKLTAFLPESASAQVNEALAKNGFPIDLKTMKNADFSELVQTLSEMDINVEDKKGDKVRIFCE